MKSAAASPGPDTLAKGIPSENSALVRRHLRFGWWSLLVFLSLGTVLELLHGIKAGLYLDVSNSTRRLMWTLAHAHGTLLALLHIAFGATTHLLPGWGSRSRHVASLFLRSATLLIPAGFFLGGLKVHGGDPGLGIMLVPLGAVLLFAAVFLVARAVGQSPGQPARKSGEGH